MQNVTTENYELLSERFPKIAFVLHATEDAPKKDFFSILPTLDLAELENIDLIYVYGLNPAFYVFLKDWLKKDRLRELVFIEDDISAIWGFLGHKKAAKILKDKQVHLELFLEDEESFCKRVALEFPITRLEVFADPTYLQQKKAKFESFRIQIFCKTTRIDGIFGERLLSSLVFKNFLENGRRFSEFFLVSKLKNAFWNIPAIICGAGPSLNNDKNLIKELSNRALIIAGGSAITALSSANVAPHLGVAVDPNFEEYSRFRSSALFEMPLFLEMRLCSAVLNTLNGFLGYLPSTSSLENYLHEHLKLEVEEIGKNLFEESLSVTPLAIALADFLGCNPIILSGVDLAYVKQQRYSRGVLPDDGKGFAQKEKKKISGERFVKGSSHQGDEVLTAIKWIMESNSIAFYAKEHKTKLFITTSFEGQKIEAITPLSLKEVAARYCQKIFDVQGKLHSCMEQNRHFVKAEDFENFGAELKQSLEKCQNFLIKLISDNAKEAFLAAFDLKDEQGYQYVLKEVEVVLNHFLQRLQKRGQIISEKDKWKHLQTVVEDYLKGLK